MSKSFATLFTLLLLVLTTQQASALDHITETQAKKLAARETITQSIREVRETQQLVDSLLRDKNSWLTEQTKQLEPCVERLTTDLTGMTYTLQRLKNLTSMTLNSMNLNSDTKSLEKMMACVGKVCDCSLENVHNLELSMLIKKLDNLPMFIYGVVYHVSMIERGDYSAGNGGKA